MAERQQKERQILSPNLSMAKKALLLQLVLMPGWSVVEEIANEACLKFTQDIIKLDPESEDYDRVMQTRTLRARNASEFSDLLFASITGHADNARNLNKQEPVEPESPTASFGIYPAKKGDPASAIKNVFGIHLAKPKKAVGK